MLYVAALDLAGNESKPYPFAIVQVRYVVLARPRVVGRAGPPVRDPGLDRCAEGALAAARPLGSRPQGDAALPRAEGRRAPTGSTSSRPATPHAAWWWSGEPGRRARRRCRRRASGWRCCSLAPRRDLRIAGLVAWAVGLRGPRHRTSRRTAITVCSPRLPWSASCLPRAGAWLVAARALAAGVRDARLRSGAHPGARRLDPGEPAAAALRRRRGRGARARMGAVRRGAARPRARAARLAGRRVRRLGRPDAPLVAGRAAGRDRAALLRAAVRPAHARAGAAAVVAALDAGALRAARGDGAGVRRDRHRPVRGRATSSGTRR